MFGPRTSVPGPSSLGPQPDALRVDDDNDNDEQAGLNDNANEEGLLAARGPQGADDDEADAIFAAVEAKMNERRRGRRVTVRKVVDPNDPATLFAAEKLKLRQVTAQEWAQLPESGDFIAKRVKRSNDKERYTPVPDSILLQSLATGVGSLGEAETMAGGRGEGETDFRAVGETREKVLGARIDMAHGGPTNGTGESGGFDTAGYLSSLESETGKAPQMNDLRRARTLLKAALQSNPTNPVAWLSAVKIEDVAGNLKRARAMLVDALEACPDSEDIWLEAVRLALPEESRLILQKALLRLPHSSRLWLFAASVEKDAVQGKKTLRRALEANPGSAMLWRALIEREEDADDARVLLAKAVECCPQSPELWIALARLESHENARKILNKARQQNPQSVAIWVAAARLEEAHGNEGGIVEKIVKRAVSELRQRGSTMTRADWIKEAYGCEDTGDIVCAQAIVQAVSSMGHEGEETSSSSSSSLQTAWTADAEAAADSGHVAVAKACLELALSQSPRSAELWQRLVRLDPSSATFERAIQACPEPALWQLYAEQTNSERIFQTALAHSPHSEALWLAWIRFVKSDSLEQYQEVIQRACSVLGSEKIWKKRVSLASHRGHIEQALNYCKEALARFPGSETLWLAMGRLDPFTWDRALQACPRSREIIVEAAAAALASSQGMRARAILERGRQTLPEDETIWLASVKLEMQLEAPSQARALMTRALQKCPLSQPLWYEAIATEAKPLRKAKATEALRRCGQNAALILLAIGHMMEAERSLTQALEYYERSVAADANIGDSWAFYILLLRRVESETNGDSDSDSGNGSRERAENALNKARAAKPKEGPRWRLFRKQSRFWRQPFDQVFSAFIESLMAGMQ